MKWFLLTLVLVAACNTPTFKCDCYPYDPPQISSRSVIQADHESFEKWCKDTCQKYCRGGGRCLPLVRESPK